MYRKFGWGGDREGRDEAVLTESPKPGKARGHQVLRAWAAEVPTHGAWFCFLGLGFGVAGAVGAAGFCSSSQE